MLFKPLQSMQEQKNVLLCIDELLLASSPQVSGVPIRSINVCHSVCSLIGIPSSAGDARLFCVLSSLEQSEFDSKAKTGSGRKILHPPLPPLQYLSSKLLFNDIYTLFDDDADIEQNKLFQYKRTLL